LNSKRQTLCNTLKGKVIEKFAEGNDEPPSPHSLFSRSEQTGEISGLRKNKDIYMKFLQDFAKAVYGKNFGVQSKSNILSTYLPTSLESFLVLAYTNGYEVWKSEAKRRQRKIRNTLVDEISTDTSGNDITDMSYEAPNPLPKYKFTANGRGSKTGEGWTEDGIALYNALFRAIRIQRKDLSNGITFEAEFLTYTVTNTAQRRNKEKKQKAESSWGELDTDLETVSQSNDTSDPVAEDDTTDPY